MNMMISLDNDRLTTSLIENVKGKRRKMQIIIRRVK
jgi:hypothetical protein